jgi:hypothetical protein
MTNEVVPTRGRGRPAKLVGERAGDTRMNVSMAPEAQAAIARMQDKLTAQFGFKPTVTQTILWAMQRAERFLDNPLAGVGR